MPKNLLIVAQSFPPLANMAARRFGFLTPHMESCGWRPWVLTTHAQGPLPVAIPDARVIRLGRHPQTSTSCHATPPPTRTPTAPERPGLSPAAHCARRAAAAVGIRLRAIDYTCFTWFRTVLRQQEALRRRLPPIDLVLGSFGPAAALWLARRLATRLGAPWVADFRDLAALCPDGRHRLSRWIDCRIERRLLRSAAGITTVSPTLRAILAETYGLPTEVVYNGWNDAPGAVPWPRLRGHAPLPTDILTASATMAPGHHGQLKDDDGSLKQDEGCLGHSAAVPQTSQPYLYYAGRWYPERRHAGRLVLEVLARRPDLHWLIRSLGPDDADDEIQTEAARLGLADRVHLRPPCHPDQVWREADRAWANLLLGDVDCSQRWSRGTLTGKFLELVAARPPVLAVTRPDSDVRPILCQTAKGAVCPDTQSIGRFLDRLQETPQAHAGNPAAVAHFSKSRQAAVLCRFLDHVIVSHPPTANPQPPIPNP